MELKEYKMELLTPLFMHGADSKGEVELRAASVKGLLRCWWRLGRTESTNELLKKENLIFGSTKNKSLISIKLKNIEWLDLKNKFKKSFYDNHQGIKYLWYNGTVTGRGNDNECKDLKKVIFNLEIGFDKKIDSSKKDSVLLAFKRLVLLGGIGSKNRRGLGRLHCEGLGESNVPETLKSLNNSFKYYSLNKKFDDQYKALNLLGSIYWIYRAKMKHGDDDNPPTGSVKKMYLSGYNNHLPSGAERYPSKVIPLVFKNDETFSCGFLLDYSDKKEEAKKVIKNYTEYLLDSKKIMKYSDDIIKETSKGFLKDMYNKNKSIIDKYKPEFSVIGG